MEKNGGGASTLVQGKIQRPALSKEITYLNPSISGAM